MIRCRFDFKYFPVLVIALVLLATLISFAQQEEKERLIFNQINQLRGPKHQLTYDSARQGYVDWYVTTKGFRKFIHSGLNCGEILAGSLKGDDFVSAWLRSKPHTKNMLDKKWKSMTVRVVETSPGYYQAVVQFFD